jgi:hypothetical protein
MTEGVYLAYPFTFTVPESDERDALRVDNSHGADVHVGLESMPQSTLDSNEKATSTRDNPSIAAVSPVASPSLRPKVSMSIASMLNSPVAPTFTRANFQKKSLQGDSADILVNDSIMTTPPLPSVHSPTSNSTHKETGDNDSLPPASLASPRRDTPIVMDNADELSGASVPPSSLSPVNRLSETRMTPRREISGPPSTPPSPVIVAPDDITPSLSSNHDRPETPVPMVIPPTLTSRNWRSPTPTPPSHEVASVKQEIQHEPFIYSDLPDASMSESILHPVEDHQLESSFRISSRSPIVIRGRLVTPPSTESNSVRAEFSPGKDEEESEEPSEEDRNTTPEHVRTEERSAPLMENSDSDSLTPAPSPCPSVHEESTGGALVIEMVPVASDIMDETPDSPAVSTVLTGEVEPNSEELKIETSDRPAPPVAISSPASVPAPLHQDDHEGGLGSPKPNSDLAPSTMEPSAPETSSSQIPPQKPVVDTQKLQTVEESTTPASAQIRRTTLKDYARRRKNHPNVPPPSAPINVPDLQGTISSTDSQNLPLNMSIENDQTQEPLQNTVRDPVPVQRDIAGTQPEIPSQLHDQGHSAQGLVAEDHLSLETASGHHTASVRVYSHF